MVCSSQAPAHHDPSEHVIATCIVDQSQDKTFSISGCEVVVCLCEILFSTHIYVACQGFVLTSTAYLKLFQHIFLALFDGKVNQTLFNGEVCGSEVSSEVNISRN